MIPVCRAIVVTCLVLSSICLLSFAPAIAQGPLPNPAADVAAPATQPARAPAPSECGTPAVAGPRPDQVIAKRLDAMLPTVDFTSARFADVLDFFRRQGQCSITVNWDALAGANVDPDTRVTLQLRKVKAGTALLAVLRGVGTFDAPLGYAVVGGVVRISTESELARITEIRVYNCGDLVQQPLTADQRQVMEAVIRERLVGAGHLSFEHALAATMDELRKQAAQDLIRLIETNVEPGTWRPDGDIGSVSEFDGLIVIRHNARAQEAVTDLLGMLREAKGAHAVNGAAGRE